MKIIGVDFSTFDVLLASTFMIAFITYLFALDEGPPLANPLTITLITLIRVSNHHKFVRVSFLMTHPFFALIFLPYFGLSLVVHLGYKD